MDREREREYRSERDTSHGSDHGSEHFSERSERSERGERPGGGHLDRVSSRRTRDHVRERSSHEDDRRSNYEEEPNPQRKERVAGGSAGGSAAGEEEDQQPDGFEERSYDKKSSSSRDRERDRERDRGRERDRERDRDRDRDRDYRERDHRDRDRDRDRDRSSRDRDRDHDRDRERDRDRDKERDSDRDRERDRNRDRDKDRARERDRDRDRDHDHDRDRGDRHRRDDRERDRDYDYDVRDRDRDRDSRARSRNYDDTNDRIGSRSTFSRPATYDPYLAQRTLQRSSTSNSRGHMYDDRDDYHGEDTRRKKKLIDDLGLSEEDYVVEEDGDSTAGATSASNNKSSQNSTSNGASDPELQKQYQKALEDLETAKQSELRANDSLSKLQLLSKSQSAIWKTTLKKKIQAKNTLIDEMRTVIQDLEKKLQSNGVTFAAYVAPDTSKEKQEELDQADESISEIASMKTEMDRLLEENRKLKQNAITSAAAGASCKPTDSNSNGSSTPQVDPSQFVAKKKFDALEAEKQSLIQLLKDAQQKISTLKKENAAKVASTTSPATSPPPAPPASTPSPAGDTAASGSAASTPSTEELRSIQKKLNDAENALQTAQNKLCEQEKATQQGQHTIEKLQKELSTAQNELSVLQTTMSSLNSSSSSMSGANEALQKQLLETKQQLEAQQKETQAKEAQGEAKLQQLKQVYDVELTKIKDQAKKAIFEMKKRLEHNTKSKQKQQAVVVQLQKAIAKQKLDLQTTKQLVQQQMELWKPSSSSGSKASGNNGFNGIALQISARFKKQQEALGEVVENYQRELKERKRLFNLVQELKGNIRVFCRIRPISKTELANGNKNACTFTAGVEEITIAGDKGKQKTYEFDKVFDGASSQEQVYVEVTGLVTSILDGYMVCIFAYGQTGSGKTHTMSGSEENPGINPRALKELFDRKNQRVKEFQDDISVSVMEIYNEQIRDLLVGDPANSNLQVRQGPQGNFVPGLTTIPVQTLEEVNDLIKKGNKNRSTHATDMNEHSSRSHSILMVQLKSTNLVTNTVASGKLFLVDLAGSERLSKTNAEGQRLKEAQSINKSLSALGDVIAARASKQKHVPYRNSSLTFLLQDALAGDSKTLLVACASPVDYNSEESMCTLNFAARARDVEMGKATKNIEKSQA